MTEATFLSVAETADLLHLSEMTVYRRIADGSLPALRLSENGAIRIPRSGIEELSASAPRTGFRPAVEAQAHAERRRPGES